MKKRILSLLTIACTAVLLTSCTSAAPAASPASSSPSGPDPALFDYTAKTYGIASFEGKYKVQGRCPVISYTPPKADEALEALALDYSCSSFSFNAYCEGDVTAEIYTAPTAIGGDMLYLNVYVDGVRNASRPEYKLTGKKVHTLTIASDLERGLHTFVIERQTEAERGLLYLNSVSLCGELYEPPGQSSLFIEFIGDSITTGYGNLYPDLTEGEQNPNPASNVYQDGTRTYAYLTAQKLGADYSIIAQQGIGISSGYYPHTMLGTYKYTCYQCDHRQPWDFERKADLVVINLGTNDRTMVSAGKTTLEKIQKGFEQFCLLVREKYPDAKILWAYGMMEQSAETQIKAALSAAGGEEAGFYYVKLASDGSGGNGHPSAAAHEENAEILTEAIKKIIASGE